jgi:tRNA nucleotidyltransferase/poly(A) polymerase
MNIKKFNDFIDVPKEVEELSSIFNSNGKKLYIVGGFIRDKIMGLDPLDIDLSTDSLPEETISFLKGKYKLDLVGKAFGVIIVNLGEMKIEIASFRKDETIGRHPEVKLGVSIEDDVMRRDITISSIFYDIQEGKIVDLVGGVNDINNKIIRMVGNPKDRLNEDQLRSLRVIRFACRYDFSIDSKTLSDLGNYTDLSKISKERIFEEIFKSYKQCGDRFKNYLEYFSKLDIWDQVFPNMIINNKILRCLGPNPFILYFANIFKNENPDGLQERLVQKCFIPIEYSRVIAFLVWFQEFTPNKINEFYSKKNNYRIDDSTIKEWISLAGLSGREFEAFVKYRPTTTSQELMDKGFKGKALGDQIKKLEIENFKSMI